MTHITDSSPIWHATDYVHMAHALRLAEQGLYTTTPNPRVGCVIAHDDRVVGTGWHRRAGEAHAEIHALREAGEQARGATAYVTLEPCSHHGRTPPCADALIAAGVSRVIAAMRDPNPLVAGQGLARLRAAGITVEHGLLQTQAHALNPGFIQRMTRQRPWLRIKTAASLDGKTALANGISQWITSADARRDAHHWRARSCALLTGIGTVLADNPRLTVRDIDTSRQPLRILLDTHLRTPADAHVLREPGTLIVHGEMRHDQDEASNTSTQRQQTLRDCGAELLSMPAVNGRIDLKELMAKLAQRGINEIMTEAGATLNGALIAAQLADEWIAYFASILMGNGAQSLFTLPALNSLDAAIRTEIHDLRKIGDDWRMIARFHPSPESPTCSG